MKAPLPPSPPAVRKRCAACGWTTAVHPGWQTKGAVAVFPCAACGHRLTADTRNAGFWERYNERAARRSVASDAPSGPNGNGGEVFRYELRLADGDDAGSFETSEPNWNVGDQFIAAGNRRYRITAMVPVARIEEFVQRPLYGVWEVEPLT